MTDCDGCFQREKHIREFYLAFVKSDPLLRRELVHRVRDLSAKADERDNAWTREVREKLLRATGLPQEMKKMLFDAYPASALFFELKVIRRDRSTGRFNWKSLVGELDGLRAEVEDLKFLGDWPGCVDLTVWVDDEILDVTFTTSEGAETENNGTYKREGDGFVASRWDGLDSPDNWRPGEKLTLDEVKEQLLETADSMAVGYTR
jgi:hypothetical protein